MKKLFILSLTCIFLSAICIAQSSTRIRNSGGSRTTYNTYENARFKYTIAYPAGILIPQPEADNADGRQFLSRDGHAKMVVFGRYALDTDTLRKEYEDAMRGRGGANRRVKLKTLKSNWFVVSGREDGKIFYQKTIYNGGAFKSFIIEYDESEKSFYDPIAARISKSFTG